MGNPAMSQDKTEATERQPRICPACGVDHNAKLPVSLRAIADWMDAASDRLRDIGTVTDEH